MGQQRTGTRSRRGQRDSPRRRLTRISKHWDGHIEGRRRGRECRLSFRSLLPRRKRRRRPGHHLRDTRWRHRRKISPNDHRRRGPRRPRAAWRRPRGNPRRRWSQRNSRRSSAKSRGRHSRRRARRRRAKARRRDAQGRSRRRRAKARRRDARGRSRRGRANARMRRGIRGRHPRGFRSNFCLRRDQGTPSRRNPTRRPRGSQRWRIRLGRVSTRRRWLHLLRRTCTSLPRWGAQGGRPPRVAALPPRWIVCAPRRHRRQRWRPAAPEPSRRQHRRQPGRPRRRRRRPQGHRLREARWHLSLRRRRPAPPVAERPPEPCRRPRVGRRPSAVDPVTHGPHVRRRGRVRDGTCLPPPRGRRRRPRKHRGRRRRRRRPRRCGVRSTVRRIHAGRPLHGNGTSPLPPPLSGVQLNLTTFLNHLEPTHGANHGRRRVRGRAWRPRRRNARGTAPRRRRRRIHCPGF